MNVYLVVKEWDAIIFKMKYLQYSLALIIFPQKIGNNKPAVLHDPYILSNNKALESDNLEIMTSELGS